ncbi:MAG TPA: DUF4834 family protein [Flavobacterium sp.]|jgi:DNA integrity scanning protein DisA with diadenylate cyclase activity|nr:DUF4834 family protein [Flavobacterium sp.]
METASFEGFLKTIVYVIAFYYIFKILARIFLPILLKKAVQKAGQNFQQQQSRQYQNPQYRPADEVHIDTSKAQKSREKKKVGEYVDYEELD